MGDARGQSLWIARDRDGSLTIEAFKPANESTDEDFLSAGVFMDVRCPAGHSTSFVAEIPYARFAGGLTGFPNFPRSTESTPGNLYLGFEGSGRGSPLFGELGVRLPTTKTKTYNANFVGTSSDFARLNAFAPREFTVDAAFNVRTVTANGIASRWRLGTAFALPTDEGGDPDVYVLYAWQTEYEGRLARVGAAVSGKILITKDRNLGTGAVDQLEFHADLGKRRIRPGLEMRLPLGSAAYSVPIVLGASISAGL
jgi:hypothetical protein